MSKYPLPAPGVIPPPRCEVHATHPALVEADTEMMRCAARLNKGLLSGKVKRGSDEHALRLQALIVAAKAVVVAGKDHARPAPDINAQVQDRYDWDHCIWCQHDVGEGCGCCTFCGGFFESDADDDLKHDCWVPPEFRTQKKR